MHITPITNLILLHSAHSAQLGALHIIMRSIQIYYFDDLWLFFMSDFIEYIHCRQVAFLSFGFMKVFGWIRKKLLTSKTEIHSKTVSFRFSSPFHWQCKLNRSKQMAKRRRMNNGSRPSDSMICTLICSSLPWSIIIIIWKIQF